MTHEQAMVELELLQEVLREIRKDFKQELKIQNLLNGNDNTIFNDTNDSKQTTS